MPNGQDLKEILAKTGAPDLDEFEAELLSSGTSLEHVAFLARKAQSEAGEMDYPAFAGYALGFLHGFATAISASPDEEA